jgi:telomerase reverse transcriptase
MLLGREGERIMVDLLVDCAIFRSVKAGKGNLYQLSGIPISELEPLAQDGDKEGLSLTVEPEKRHVERRPSEISFVRSRMLYARAALNARGLVYFGLRHIRMFTYPLVINTDRATLMLLDVLNRFPYKGPCPSTADAGKKDDSVVHIMMYMFPRQFGLHNVFTSTVDRQQTAQKFQDYTLREEEIAQKFPAAEAGAKPTKHVPKRLRGKLMSLVQRLQVLHKRCSYAELLHHYCPVSKETDGKWRRANLRRYTDKLAARERPRQTQLRLSHRPPEP